MDKAIDRLALAREVIVSAANVLRAAGFERGEIAGFFEDAAAQLGGGEVGADDPLTVVAQRFARCGPVGALQELAGEALPLLPLGEDLAALKATFDLAMRIVPQLAEAQAALRGLAREAGLPLAATEAQSGEVGAEVVCLERFAGAYSGAVAVIGAVVEALVARGDGEAFAFLLRHLADNEVVIAGPLQGHLEKGAGLLE